MQAGPDGLMVGGIAYDGMGQVVVGGGVSSRQVDVMLISTKVLSDTKSRSMTLFASFPVFWGRGLSFCLCNLF